MPALREADGVLSELYVPADDLDSLLLVVYPLDGDVEGEPVCELGPQLPLLRVHRPDQYEPRRVGDGDPLPLHGVPAGGGRVQDAVCYVVREEVDLVDVEYVLVRLGEEAGLEGPDAVADGLLYVEAPYDPVLRRADREGDDPHLPPLHLRVLPSPVSLQAGGAHVRRVGRAAVEGAPLYCGYLREYVDEGSDAAALPRPLLTPDEEASDHWVDGVQKQRRLHLGLPDEGREGVDQAMEGQFC